MSQIKSCTGDEVLTLIRENRGLLLVHFYSPLHSSSDFLSRGLNLVAPHFLGRVQFAEVQPLQDLEIAQGFAIDQLPTLILFVHDREVERIEHVMLPEELSEFLETAAAFYASAGGDEGVY
ncbi:MAG: hypothetical protein KDC38_01665 [Planctomycetes bacterium]|nr:hypothetical protein [Planctomycetota bacterium]